MRADPTTMPRRHKDHKHSLSSRLYSAMKILLIILGILTLLNALRARFDPKYYLVASRGRRARSQYVRRGNRVVRRPAGHILHANRVAPRPFQPLPDAVLSLLGRSWSFVRRNRGMHFLLVCTACLAAASLRFQLPNQGDHSHQVTRPASTAELAELKKNYTEQLRQNPTDTSLAWQLFTLYRKQLPVVTIPTKDDLRPARLTLFWVIVLSAALTEIYLCLRIPMRNPLIRGLYRLWRFVTIRPMPP